MRGFFTLAHSDLTAHAENSLLYMKNSQDRTLLDLFWMKYLFCLYLLYIFIHIHLVLQECLYNMYIVIKLCTIPERHFLLMNDLILQSGRLRLLTHPQSSWLLACRPDQTVKSVLKVFLKLYFSKCVWVDPIT